MRATFGEIGIMAVIDGEEDVCCAGEVWEGFFEGKRVGCLHEHEGHRGSEEDDVGAFVLAEEFVFKVSRRIVSSGTWPGLPLTAQPEEVAYSSQNDMTCKKY